MFGCHSDHRAEAEQVTMFCLFITELWPLIDVIICLPSISLESVDRIVTELWHLIDV